MARPKKMGLEYFPCDTDMYEDSKINDLIRACGAGAIAIWIILLCNIYKDSGYYVELDKEQLNNMIDQTKMKKNRIIEIIKKCVQLELFDPESYERHNILTSKPIQERYKLATKERKIANIKPEIDLTGETVLTNPKEIETPKIKEEKVPYEKIKELYNTICGSGFSKIIKINGERKSKVSARYKEFGLEKIEECFKKMASSKFLQGENQRGWKAEFDWAILPTNFAKILEGKYDNRPEKTESNIPANNPNDYSKYIVDEDDNTWT